MSAHGDLLLLRAQTLRLASRARRRRSLRAIASTAGEKSKVVVLSGPTGAGKTKLALELAKRINGEIISADSVQIYRGLDVGSAKPSIESRDGVPHHLLDVLDPAEDYSVGQFFHDARAATAAVVARGRAPIVVGGTGLYLRWFTHGKPPVPAATAAGSAAAAAELLPFQKSARWSDAVELVATAGDPLARALPANDWYRLRRSLEIVRSTGSPPSAFPLPHKTHAAELDYDFLCFFLSAPRLGLYRAIDRRCEEMVEGLLAEAAWLLDRGLLPNTASATRAIGYRHAMEYLLHCRELAGDCSREDLLAFLAEFQKASRNFAKRQMTWFRSETNYLWLDASRPMEEVLGFVIDAFQAPPGSPAPAHGIGLKKLSLGRHESFELKAYRPQNTIFAQAQNCDMVLDWIRRTQPPPRSMKMNLDSAPEVAPSFTA
ncbi:isopentenyltransferase 9 [Wolffia australiana]